MKLRRYKLNKSRITLLRDQMTEQVAKNEPLNTRKMVEMIIQLNRVLNDFVQEDGYSNTSATAQMPIVYEITPKKSN
jgi:hypothetical protein